MHSRNEEGRREDKEEEITRKGRTLQGAAPKTLKAGDEGRAQQLVTGENNKKTEMLKSSSALDRFHWILKMKRRVGEGGGGRGRGRGEKKAAKQKRENRSNISSTLQRC